ncbi:MAG: hypothetical protein GYA56_05185, partial [Geobacteraceae bacterium]|nr:hypothetical protein [Geobacteraceae bacterium]
IFGTPVTPFGPEWLDRLLSGIFRLSGDFVNDFRLLDYLVSLLSTERSPALDGTLGNGDRLKDDLAELGVFDAGMSLYHLVKLREFRRMGFSGFEARHYSLFESMRDDMGPAVTLQNLIHACAFRMIAEGTVTHCDIPDTPHGESERRQMFFGDAIGLSSFHVRRNTENRFLLAILKRAAAVRPSARYPDFFTVKSADYRRALLRTLEEEAGELVEMLGARSVLDDLKARIEDPALTASGRLSRGILESMGARHPLSVPAGEFNGAAERYYRGHLCRKHMAEAFSFLEEDFRRADQWKEGEKTIVKNELKGGDALSFLASCRNDVLGDTVPAHVLESLIRLVILSIHHDTVEAGTAHA